MAAQAGRFFLKSLKITSPWLLSLLKTAQDMTAIHSEQNAVWQRRHGLNHQLISAVSLNANEEYMPV